LRCSHLPSLIVVNLATTTHTNHHHHHHHQSSIIHRQLRATKGGELASWGESADIANLHERIWSRGIDDDVLVLLKRLCD
jgi:hypothetical protein